MSLLLSLLLAQAQAAPPPPSKAEVEAIRTMHLIANCLATRHADEARKVLALDFRSRGYRQALPQLGKLGGQCTRDQLGRVTFRSAGLPFAGSVAEALLKRDGALADFAARTGYRPELPGIEARNASEFVAFCTIRKNPAGTAAVLQAEPASPAEASAFASITPTMTGCVPANSKLEFGYESLRALLALGAYRLAMHNSAAADTAGEAGL